MNFEDAMRQAQETILGGPSREPFYLTPQGPIKFSRGDEEWRTMMNRIRGNRVIVKTFDDADEFAETGLNIQRDMCMGLINPLAFFYCLPLEDQIVLVELVPRREVNLYSLASFCMPMNATPDEIDRTAERLAAQKYWIHATFPLPSVVVSLYHQAIAAAIDEYLA